MEWNARAMPVNFLHNFSDAPDESGFIYVCVTSVNGLYMMRWNYDAALARLEDENDEIR